MSVPGARRIPVGASEHAASAHEAPYAVVGCIGLLATLWYLANPGFEAIGVLFSGFLESLSHTAGKVASRLPYLLSKF